MSKKLRDVGRNNNALEDKIKRHIEEIEHIDAEMRRLQKQIRYAERIYRVACEIGMLEELEEHIGEVPPYIDFFQHMAELEERRSELITRGEVLSREMTEGSVSHLGWVCKSRAGRKMRTYRPERIKMSDYADLEMHGERLVEMKPVLNESVWKAAVEANIIDEAKAVRDGLLEIRRAARSKHFKRAKRRTGEKNGRNK